MSPTARGLATPGWSWRHSRCWELAPPWTHAMPLLLVLTWRQCGPEPCGGSPTGTPEPTATRFVAGANHAARPVRSATASRAVARPVPAWVALRTCVPAALNGIGPKPAPRRARRGIAKRKLRRRQLTEDGNVEISGRDLRGGRFGAAVREGTDEAASTACCRQSPRV